MSYQVLARKYRPQNFTELVGQEHVTQALVNGLEQGRLHHAFLFTGTRGVGKTTLARIIAKALNCAKGVTGHPCGECEACREIAEGRFVDLVEVDAASRTGVDDTRELLENVQYAPSKGRYKIYLIDEVHMFSNSSFNALLKTLEEPPPHVKFLLATTEPAKLPITVLSRCLQFNLKRLDIDQISQHLATLLQKEGVEFEAPALELLARAADGSMRDALSLLDQALAFGAGRITREDVSLMLGVIEQRHIVDLLDAIIAEDSDRLEQVMQRLFEQSPDYGRVLQDLALLLHEISLQQILAKAPPNALFDRTVVVEFGKQLSPEITQLYYQICIIGHQELTMAPDAKTGFEATVLRLFGFTLPEQNAAAQPAGDQNGTQRVPGVPTSSTPAPPDRQPSPHSGLHSPPTTASSSRATTKNEEPTRQPLTSPGQKNDATSARPGQQRAGDNLPVLATENWGAIFQSLGLKGSARELARHCRIEQVDEPHLKLAVDENYKVMLRDRPRHALIEALQQAYGSHWRIQFSIDTGTQEQAPLEVDTKPTVARSDQGVKDPVIQSVQQDPLVKSLKEQFDAEIIDVQPNRKRG